MLTTLVSNQTRFFGSLSFPLGAKTTKGADGVSRIESITVSCETNPITATVFIDASYDGDVMVAAGDIEYDALLT